MKKIALVTGGSKGIGASTCRTLAREGYFVLIHYNQSKKEAFQLAEEIGGEPIFANLEQDEDINVMANHLKEKFGKLDILINNAGIAECESLKDLTRNSFFKTLQVNLWSHTLLTKLLTPIMDEGSIIFTSSVCAKLPTPDALSYAASKAGIEAIVRSLAAELAPNIRINAVAPSCTDTDMMKKNYSAEDREWVRENFPMKRPCDPEDIAEMISFLVSNKAKNITGQVFTVDSGATVRQ
ncbi:MAG: SDR family oxidoreductase [Alphaproteobacteria bacterium]|nr:SDR family oxidoreductase [Alphaproteobacteria bacterium]